MEITLVTAETYHGAVVAAAQKLANASEKPDEKYLVFCEDKLSVTLEREILKKQRGGCSFNIEVSTFSRFLIRHFAVRSTLSKEGATMAVSRIMAQHSEKLSVLAGMRLKKNTASTIYEQIMQLRSAEITPDALLNFKNESVLGKKVADVGEIYREYMQFISGGYLDESEALSILPRKIRQSKILDGAHVFLVGYSSFTAQMGEIIRSICECAASLSAVFAGAVNIESDGGDGEASRYFQCLIKKQGYTFQKERWLEKLPTEAEALSRHLFSHTCFNIKERINTNNVMCYYAENNADEISFIAKNIAFGVREGKRYRDFALLIHEPKEYSAKLEEVFEDYRIPYFLDEEKSLCESVLFSLLSLQIEISRKNFAAEDVIAFVKNVLFENDFEKSDAFENYALSRGINRNGFFRKFDDEKAEYIREKFARVFLSLPQKSSAGNFAALLKEQAQILCAEEGLKSLQSALEENGEAVAAEYTQQIYEKTISLLDQIENIMGEEELTLEDFKNIFSSGAMSMKIKLIPAYYDAVNVGKIDESKCIDAKYIFAAGLSSDVPDAMADTAFFNDRDITVLKESGISLEPEIRVVNQRKRNAVAAALISFKEKLFLSFSALSVKGKTLKRSEIFDYAERIFCRGDKDLPRWSNTALQKAFEAACENKRLNYASLQYLNIRAGLKNFAAAAGAYADNAPCDVRKLSAFYVALKMRGLQDKADEILEKTGVVSSLRISKDKLLTNAKISASALEEYFACPYKYFLARVLKLKRRDRFAMRSEDAGIFLHKSVELFVNKLKSQDQRSPDEITQECFDEILSEDKYRAKLESPAQCALFERLIKEGKKNCRIIYNQIKNSDFKIMGTEINFGYGEGDYPPLKFSSGGEYSLIGKIDRADCTDTHIRIVDYKSGKIDTADSNLFTGRKLQLYLYMAALCQGTGKNAAGVYYYPINDEFSEENTNLLTGNSLDDCRVILAQDKELSLNNPNSSNIALKFKIQEGSLKPIGSSLLKKEEFDAYLEYAKKVSEKALSEIASGNIELSPYKGNCDFCEMSGVCGYEEELCAKTRCVAKVNKAIVCAAVNTSTEDKEEI